MISCRNTVRGDECFFSLVYTGGIYFLAFSCGYRCSTLRVWDDFFSFEREPIVSFSVCRVLFKKVISKSGQPNEVNGFK